MGPELLDIRQLRYFVAVAEYGSFRAAAERLHITQPPLTRQIQQMEEALQTPLFIRLATGVELTAAGRTLYEDAIGILNLSEQAVVRSRLAGRGELGRLDVGVFGSAALDVVPRIIQRFREQHPKVEVSLHNLNRVGQLKALGERRLTVGFNRFFSDEPGMSWEAILSEKLHVATYLAHPLSQLAAIGFDDLKGQPLILYPRTRPGFIDHVSRILQDRGIVPKIVQEVDDVVIAVALVAAGAGLSLVVDSACNLRLPSVRYVPLTEKDLVRFDLCMIRRSDDNSPVLEAFLKVVRDYQKQSAEKQRAESAQG